MNFGAFGGFRGMPQRFDEQYHCYSMAYAEKGHLEVSRTNERQCYTMIYNAMSRYTIIKASFDIQISIPALLEIF